MHANIDTYLPTYVRTYIHTILKILCACVAAVMLPEPKSWSPPADHTFHSWCIRWTTTSATGDLGGWEQSRRTLGPLAPDVVRNGRIMQSNCLLIEWEECVVTC